MSSAGRARSRVDACQAAFEAAWPDALAVFSPYTRLLPPILCRTQAQDKREGLSQSFAMIRMRDNRIVISLSEVVELELQRHAYAILAHEVGHYVHAPGTLQEHVRLHDRIVRSLPKALQSYAPVVANLYTDLLLNDRLQRSCGVDIAAVYEALRSDDEVAPLWSVYLRMYERLWGLRAGRLVAPPPIAIDTDAELGARLVRLFRQRWLDGAAPFALLIAPYFENLPQDRASLPAWLDTAATPLGDAIPDGLTEDDFDPSDVVHPALDNRITGEGQGLEPPEGELDGQAVMPGAQPMRSLRGDGRPDKRRMQRGPRQYVDLLRALGVKRTPQALVARYYRELALEHVIPFPSQMLARASDPLVEGLKVWEPGSDLAQLDWMQTLFRSPLVVPGVTTVQRSYGQTQGGEPARRPPDLYVGIDCSGSMGNPAYKLAYPVVAGVVLALSALRAGARVMACLSGEWHGRGRYVDSGDFIRDEDKLLGVLTDYLGTGASFGLPRLATTFANRPPRQRPAHILVVSDSDLFREIDGTEGGWAIARKAVERAGGGATAVLRLASEEPYRPWLDKLAEAGFSTHCVGSEQQLVDFARAFSRRTFSCDEPGR